MSWQSRYAAIDLSIWKGRQDIPDDSCFYQQIKVINLLEETPPPATDVTFAFIGFKCDEGIKRDLGREGAKEGPTTVRKRLARLPIQKSNLVCYDAGDIVCNDFNLEETQLALAEVVNILLQQNIRPIVIGGGHELAWGHYQGIAKTYSPQKRLGIINFDAHFDLNPLHAYQLGGASTSFHQIAEDQKKCKRHFDYNCIGIQHAANIRQSFETAKRYKTHIILADEMHLGLKEKCIDFVDRVIDENEIIYLSLSLDVFSAAFAPGVSSIQPLGLNPWHIIPLLRQLASSGKVISYDIAECLPEYDIDARTAKLAATLIYEIIHHHNPHAKKSD